MPYRRTSECSFLTDFWTVLSLLRGGVSVFKNMKTLVFLEISVRMFE